MLGKILKTLLVILLLAALGALAYWLCLIKGWPWWVAAVLLAGVVGLWIGFLYLKKYLLRSRERKFVQRVIEQDSAAIAKVPVSERHQLLELQEHWKESIQRLQDSHLRKRGNPLYVLPWYLVLGESGAGKTSAIRNSRLSSPMTEVVRATGLSGTRNCDWWFFEQAVVLDTAGRYTIPVEEVQDLEEWKRFLTLLSKYRKKEPLNGVVVAVAADRLLSADEKVLREDGQMVRQRIDQTMRVVGAKFPVYLLVTKMDLVHGFTGFSRHLPSDSLSQAMGHNNKKNKVYWQDVLDEGMASVGERLRRLRFILVHEAGRMAPSAILFPQEFERLKPGLEGFLRAIFEENPYQETPLLRGIYFSSARRDGTPTSPFLETVGLQPGKGDSVDSEEGFFLGDFFAKILPNDRNLYSAIREFVLWKRLTRSLGLLSWLLIGLAACGILTFSFYKNADTIQEFKEDFFYPPRLTGNRSTDLETLDKFRIEILDMQQRNRSWLLPRLGLDHSRKTVNELKRHFSRLFRDGFLKPVDDRLFEHIGEVNQNTPEEEFVDYVGYVVARITILKEQLAGRKLPLANEFKKITSSLLETQDPQLKVAPQIAAKFGDVYYAYLDWGAERRDSEERLAQFRVALVQLLDRKGSDLRWLVRKWVPGVPDIRLTDFWGVTEIGDYKSKVLLSGAYTEGGRKRIEEFIKLIESALGDEKAKAPFEKRKKEFWIWYRQEFFRAWLKFIESYHEGLNRLDTIAGWQRMASLMTTERNPYFVLLDRVANEIDLLHPDQEVPPWAAMVTRLKKVRQLAKVEKEKDKGGSITGKLRAKEAELKEKVFEKTDAEKAKDLDEMMLQGKAWNEYLETLAKINVGVSSRKECYDMYSGSFPYMEAPNTELSPFAIAYSSYYKLKGLLDGKMDLPEIWDLIFGPMDFVMAYASDETSCFLQGQWEEQVLGVVQEADPDRAARVLFNKTEGVVWKYIENTAKPFLGRSEAGYYARQDFRKHAIPFKPEFIQFLNQGSEGVINYEPSYTVFLETLPLDVNDDAKVEPLSCVLTVNCSDGNKSLENYNFPNSASITWDPDKCGDVSLTLSFPLVTLRKVYRGKMGFPQFLKEFRDGSRTFSVDDFLVNSGELVSMGVTSIKVSYRIKGAEPVILLLRRVPTKVPPTIVTCFARGKR